MTDLATVGEIIKEYEKHGWTLRRALLSDENRVVLAPLLDSVDIVSSDLEALWFSRRSTPESEAWELRRLKGLPFALIAVVSATASVDEVESTLSQVVDDMRSRTFA